MNGLLRNTHLLLGGRPWLSAGVLAPLRRCEEKNEEREGRSGSLTLSAWRDWGSSLLFDSLERRVREFWANDGLTIKLTLYSNSVAKMTSGWRNLHFRHTVEHLIAPRWAKIAMVLLKSNYNEA